MQIGLSFFLDVEEGWEVPEEFVSRVLEKFLTRSVVVDKTEDVNYEEGMVCCSTSWTTRENVWLIVGSGSINNNWAQLLLK